MRGVHVHGRKILQRFIESCSTAPKILRALVLVTRMLLHGVQSGNLPDSSLCARAHEMVLCVMRVTGASKTIGQVL
jgi:hypothetical protein